MTASYQSAELALRDTQAPDYDRWMLATKGRFFDSREKSVFCDLVRSKGVQSVLEIGCGTGRITGAVAPHVGSIAALDFSEQSLKVVRANRMGNVTPHCANACDGLPFRSGTFDWILSCQVLQHLKENDLLALLGECYRVLKSRGRLAFSAYNLDYFGYLDSEETAGNGLYSKRFSRGYVRFLTATSGFQLGEIHYYKALPARVCGLAPASGTLLKLDQIICALPGAGPHLAGYMLPVFIKAR